MGRRHRTRIVDQIMNNIDFLPQDYRREHSRRRRQVWQITAITIVTVIVGAASFFQTRTAAKLQADIDKLGPRHQKSENRNKQFAELKTELQNAEDQAALFTYLRHPWPKTQIIAALIRALPEDITLQEITISNTMPKSARRNNILSQTEREAEEKRLAALSPAARDLEELRKKSDRLQTQINIRGTAIQQSALHVYVGNLAQESLLAKAELESCEAEKGPVIGKMRFNIDVLVKPGYGQPNGPRGRLAVNRGRGSEVRAQRAEDRG